MITEKWSQTAIDNFNNLYDKRVFCILKRILPLISIFIQIKILNNILKHSDMQNACINHFQTQISVPSVFSFINYELNFPDLFLLTLFFSIFRSSLWDLYKHQKYKIIFKSILINLLPLSKFSSGVKLPGFHFGLNN